MNDPLKRLTTKRGSQLPQSKLNEEKVARILRKAERRQELKAEIDTLSSAAIAKAEGVHVRTIERIIKGYGWTHVH